MYPRLKELRLENRWTQKEVAGHLGCHVGTYGCYERGKTDIPTVSMMKLAYLYDVSLHYILGLTDDRTPHRSCTFEEWREQIGF